MSSAKVIIKQQDRSSIVPSLPGIYGGIVIRSKKGPVGKPTLITSENELIDVFGEPDTRYPEFYSAIVYLQESDKLWVTRAAHDDVKYAGALVRSKVKDVPTDAFTPFDNEMLTVKPIEGLTEKELESFVFPMYETNKEYELESSKILEDSDKDEIIVDTFDNLKIQDRVSFSDKTLNELNSSEDKVGEEEPTYTVTDLLTKKVDYDLIKIDDSVDINKGDEILVKNSDGDYVSYDPQVFAGRSATSSDQLLVLNADAMQDDDEIKIGDTETTFKEKDKVTIEEKYIKVDSNVVVTKDLKVYKVIQAQFEERDSFLVVGKDPSVDFNKISVGTTPSKNYENAFNVIVYYDGVLVETWEVTKEDFIDGFGKQMYLEDKINEKSKYIKVIDNKNLEKLPLITDHSYWRQLEEDIFLPKENYLAEDVLKDHIYVTLDSVDELEVDDRIKFAYDVDANGDVILTKEYKIAEINSDDKIIKLDRKFEEYEIEKTYTDLDGNEVKTQVYKFDKEYTDLDKNILNGVKHYTISRLDKVFYNYPLGKIIYIKDIAGKLLDAGVNLMKGGNEGSLITTKDMIEALNTMFNYAETPVTLIMSGGYYDTAYVQEMKKLVDTTDLSHGYISSNPNVEDTTDWKNGLAKDVARLNLNTEKMSYFAGWVKIYDRYNQKYVWVGPDAFAAASQSYTYRNYYMWYPAAGWLRGRITVIDSKIKPNEGDRDFLTENKINPLKYTKKDGFAIWGNKTLYSKPSPLNDRSVAMLLIVIKYGVKNMLEYKLFELNTERTWTITEKAIFDFLADIKSKQGLYDYQVAIKSIITPQDIDNNTMPVFIGIKPTRSIELIPVTLAIYNNGADIKVEL